MYKILTTAILSFFAINLAAQDRPVSPVVVELFTSEGCSSCPPADALLAQLEKSASINGHPIIILGEHVDYWNRLGWRDRFSSAQFSARQSDYSRRFGTGSVYTPQMVVDGRTEFVGNNAAALQKAFANLNTSAATVSIEVSRDNAARVSVQNASAGSRVFLAITETNLTTSVHSGENKNRELRHAGVVRQLRDLGVTNGNSTHKVQLALDPTWKRENVRVVAFTQAGAGGPIEGAASGSLP